MLIHQSLIHQTCLSFRGPCNQRLALIAPATETPPESTRHHLASQPAQPCSPASPAQAGGPSPASRARPAIPTRLSQPSPQSGQPGSNRLVCSSEPHPLHASCVLGQPESSGAQTNSAAQKEPNWSQKAPNASGVEGHTNRQPDLIHQTLYTRLFSDHHGLGITKKFGV